MPDVPLEHASEPGWLGILRVAGRSLLDLLYPSRCAGCGRLGDFFCADCQRRIVPVVPDACPRCGSPSTRPGRICPACRRRGAALDGLLASGLFAPPLRAAIHSFKYRGVTALAEPLGMCLADTWLAAANHADLIVPVPLHPSREAQRGYNQAALLAEGLARRLDLPARTDLLVRRRDTAAQVGLSWPERQANVRDAFACCGDARHRRILLVDDVCTTGSTLEACAEALRRGGAILVWGLTVARAQWGPNHGCPAPDAPGAAGAATAAGRTR